MIIDDNQAKTIPIWTQDWRACEPLSTNCLDLTLTCSRDLLSIWTSETKRHAYEYTLTDMPRRVTDFEENNQMTADSLATVFSPNLIRSADDDVGFFFSNMSRAHRATKMLISHVRINVTLSEATIHSVPRHMSYSTTSSRTLMLITKQTLRRSTNTLTRLSPRRTKKRSCAQRVMKPRMTRTVTSKPRS